MRASLAAKQALAEPVFLGAYNRAAVAASKPETGSQAAVVSALGICSRSVAVLAAVNGNLAVCGVAVVMLGLVVEKYVEMMLSDNQAVSLMEEPDNRAVAVAAVRVCIPQGEVGFVVVAHSLPLLAVWTSVARNPLPELV
jgi:hypothetical protein